MTLANSRGGLVAFTLATLGMLFVRSRFLFLLALLVVVWGINYPQYLPETISGRLFNTVNLEAISDDYPTLQQGVMSVQSVSPQGITREFPTMTPEPAIGPETGRLESLDPSASSRLAIWKAGILLWKDSPWFGHGYGTFPHLVGEYNYMVALRDPHNSYLGIAAEMGVLALAAFLVTMLLILRAALHVYHHAPDMFMRSVGLACVGMIMGVLAANIFGSRLDTMELTAYLWIISAMVVQYHREIRLRERAVEYERKIVLDPWKQLEAAG